MCLCMCVGVGLCPHNGEIKEDTVSLCVCVYTAFSIYYHSVGVCLDQPEHNGKIKAFGVCVCVCDVERKQIF